MPPSTVNEITKTKTRTLLIAYWSHASHTEQYLIEKLPVKIYALSHSLSRGGFTNDPRAKLSYLENNWRIWMINQTNTQWLHGDRSSKNYDVGIVVRARHEVMPHADPCDSFLHDAVIRSELNKNLIDIWLALKRRPWVAQCSSDSFHRNHWINFLAKRHRRDSTEVRPILRGSQSVVSNQVC